MSEDALKALANPTNQAILSLLAIESTYPRRVSDLLSLAESDVSRRLRRLEEAGLVSSEWEHVDGKNVKTYVLAADEVEIQIRGEGLAVESRRTSGDGSVRTVVDRLEVRIPDVEGFVGREPELEALGGPEPVVLVEGIAGVGKTSLAAAYARRERDGQPVFFHDFSGTESLTWLTHRFGVFRARHGDHELLDAIEGGAPIEDRRELLLQTLEEDPGVVVLDEVERVRDEDLRHLLEEAVERVHGGKLVVCGRRAPSPGPAGDRVRRLRLGGLSPEAVGALFEARGLDVEDGLVRRVAETLGGHPLAVELFIEAASGSERSVDALLGTVPDQRTEEFLVEEVHEGLSEPERRVLAHASVFQGPFSREDVEAVYPGNAGGALIELRRRRLLREEGRAYRLHDLLRAFFRDHLEDPGAVHERAAEHALGKGTLEARLEAMHHLLEAGERRRVLRLLEEDLDLEEFGRVERGYLNLYLDVLERLDPERIRDEVVSGLVHDERGDIRHHRGDHDRALDHYREAAKRFEAGGDGSRLADVAWKRALALRALGREDEAAKRVREGLGEHEPDRRTRERLEALAREVGVEVEGKGG